jgi:uncharacterized protein (TIGR03083 family)
MTERGVEALKADREAVLEVARSLSPEEWAAASDCAGWRVQDVIAHMSSVFLSVVDPSRLPPGVPGDLEASQEAPVAERRDWAPEQVLAEYEELSEKAIDAVAGLQAPGMSETVIPIENAGMYPLHLVANAFAFDHFCHLRNDILQPNGPIDRPVPPADETRIGATLDWLIAGLPQMSAAATDAAVVKPMTLRIDGPGGGAWTIRPPAGEGHAQVEEGEAADAAAVVTTTGEDFVLWSTGRRPWRERNVKVEGDESYAASVLDAIKLF